MLAVWRYARDLLRDRRGGAAIEYGLIAALVVVAILASLASLARTTTGLWGNVHDRVTENTGGR